MVNIRERGGSEGFKKRGGLRGCTCVWEDDGGKCC